MATRMLHALALASVLALAGPAVAQPSVEYTRGEALYKDNCDACHSERMHWRAERLATDWESLKAQVRRWQGSGRLGWSESDVMAVALYLNGRYYSFPVIPGRVMLRPGRPATPPVPPEVRTARACTALPQAGAC